MPYITTPQGRVFIPEKKFSAPVIKHDAVDLSKKKALVYGYGIFDVFLAQTLAQDYGEVFLFVPWMGPWPTPDYQDIGRGIPGITRVLSYEDTKAIVKEGRGTFYFFDVGDGDKQRELRKEGCYVFGTGDSERLEIDRYYFKEILKQQGLPYAPYMPPVYGIDALSEIIRKEDDLWIKMDVNVRGIKETFHHIDWKSSVNEIDEMAHRLGYKRDTTKFMIETPVEKDGVEIGDDSFRLHGESLEYSLYGIELKGDGYVCKPMRKETLPKPIRTVNEAMLPVYRQYNINGAMSSEVRYGPEMKKPVYIDACQRMGNPPAASISEIYKNFSAIAEGIARGVAVEQEFKAKYAAELSVDALNADTESIPMDYNPDKDFHKIKLRRATCEAGQYYNIPFRDKAPTVVKAVGLGNTLEEAEANCLEAAENFKCKGKTYNKNTFNDLNEEIKKCAALGIETM